MPLVYYKDEILSPCFKIETSTFYRITHNQQYFHIAFMNARRTQLLNINFITCAKRYETLFLKINPLPTLYKISQAVTIYINCVFGS